MDNNKIDEGLQGNEKIETAIAALQQEASEEMLAHTLTVIRRRMKEGGQFIVAVEPPTGGNQMQIQAVQTPDGNSWWAAFTPRPWCRAMSMPAPGAAAWWPA